MVAIQILRGRSDTLQDKVSVLGTLQFPRKRWGNWVKTCTLFSLSYVNLPLHRSYVRLIRRCTIHTGPSMAQKTVWTWDSHPNRGRHPGTVHSRRGEVRTWLLLLLSQLWSRGTDPVEKRDSRTETTLKRACTLKVCCIAHRVVPGLCQYYFLWSFTA